MIKHLSIIVATVLVLAGCSATPGDDSQTGSVPRTGTSGPPPTGSWSAADDGNTDPRLNGLTSNDWDVTVVSDQLNYPCEVRVSDGTVIVTEVAGTIAMIDTAGRLERHEVRASEPVVHDGGSGLMGLALADDFADTPDGNLYATTGWVHNKRLPPGHQQPGREDPATGP